MYVLYVFQVSLIYISKSWFYVLINMFSLTLLFLRNKLGIEMYVCHLSLESKIHVI